MELLPGALGAAPDPGRDNQSGYTTAVFAIIDREACDRWPQGEETLGDKMPVYLALKDSFDPDISRMLSPEQAAGMVKLARRYSELTGRIPAASVPETAFTQAHQNVLAGIIECSDCEIPMPNADGEFVYPGNATSMA